MPLLTLGDSMPYFHIIYPENRLVSDEWIASQYADALANGYIGAEYSEANDVVRQAFALSDAGIITLSADADSE